MGGESCSMLSGRQPNGSNAPCAKTWVSTWYVSAKLLVKNAEKGPNLVSHGLTHVSNDDFIALGHGRVRGVHEHVLKCIERIRGPLCSGFADESCNRSMIRSSLLHVHLEIMEMFVRGLGEHSHILFEGITVLLPECLCALQNHQFAHRVCRKSNKLRRIPSRVRISDVLFAKIVDIGI